MIKVTNKTELVIQILRDAVGENNLVDVGHGAADILGVSQTTMIRSIRDLCDNGYRIFYIQTMDKEDRKTSFKILTRNTISFATVMERRNEIKSLESPSQKYNRTSRERALKAIEKSDSRVNLAEEVSAMVMAGYDVKDIARAKGLKTADVMDMLDNPPAISTRRMVSAVLMDQRNDRVTRSIRELKKKGLSNVAIGKQMGVSESTVRRHLKKPLDPIEEFNEEMLLILEEAREDILLKMTGNPLFEKVFGEGFGDDYILSVHTAKRNVQYNASVNQVQFLLNFSAAGRRL